MAEHENDNTVMEAFDDILEILDDHDLEDAEAAEVTMLLLARIATKDVCCLKHAKALITAIAKDAKGVASDFMKGDDEDAAVAEAIPAGRTVN